MIYNFNVGECSMEDSNYGNKGANNGFLYLLLVLVIVVSVGALGYTYIYMNNPKNIYTNLVNHTYDALDLEDKDNIKLTYDLSLNVQSGSLDDDTINLLNSLRIGGLSYITKKDKYVVYNAKISNSDGNLFDVSMTYKDKNAYFDLGDLFDKNIRVELDDENSKKIDDMIMNYNPENTKKLVGELKNAFLSSISDEVIVQENETITINNKEMKVTNNKLEINSINFSAIKDKFVDYLRASDDFVDSAVLVSGLTKEEILDTLNSKDGFNLTSKDSIVINVYTEGLMSKFVSIKCVYVEGEDEVTFTYDGTTAKISSKGNTITVKEESENKFSYEVISNSEEKMKFDIRGNISMSYEEYSLPNIDNSVLLSELTENDMALIIENLSKNEAIANIVGNVIGGNEEINFDESELNGF